MLGRCELQHGYLPHSETEEMNADLSEGEKDAREPINDRFPGQAGFDVLVSVKK